MGKQLQERETECENPRTVIRGLDSQNIKHGPGSVGIHWLRGTVLETELEWLEDQFDALFGAESESFDHGFWNFDRHTAWPTGAMILEHSTEKGRQLTNGRIALDIPGKALEKLSMRQIGWFCSNLASHGFQASRIDVFYDDPCRVVTPREIFQTVYEPSLFETGKKSGALKWDISGFHTIQYRQQGSKKDGMTHDEVSFGRRGSKGSGKYLRVYDKELESQGENQAVRWELELSGKVADKAFGRIVEAFGADSDSDRLAFELGRFIGGCVDFIERTDRVGDKNLERLDRYAFWQKILDSLGRARLAVAWIKKTVDRSRRWVQRQLAGTFQMLDRADGRSRLFSLIEGMIDGEDRMNHAHKRALDEYKSPSEPDFRKWIGGFIRDQLPAVQ